MTHAERSGYRLVRQPPRVDAPLDLDAAQQAVVDHVGGPLLVLAGPGTGKTATIVSAVVDRIAGRGADPESVLMLTFSRRAAIELRGRVTARLGRTTREPLARTFHSYAFGLLRTQAVARGEPVPRLLSGPEQDLVIRELLIGQYEDGGRPWPEELRAALRTRGFAEELRDLLLRAVERGVDAPTLAAYGRKLKRPDWRAAAYFLQEYLDVTALSGSTAYDPAELIRAALDALRGDPVLLSRERARRRRIFVDEYQDTDPAQEELLQVLGAGADELVVVGDPDQSIYAFRGADPEALRRFPESFPRTDGTPAPSVALRVSRRSGGGLLAASRRVADRLTGPVAHRRLEPAEDLPAGSAEVHVLRSASEEAAYIAHRLRAAHLRDGVPWREMAVLVRSTPRTLPQLRRALLSAGVPLTVGGDDLPLIDQPSISALLLLLRVALGSVPLTEESAVELLTSPFGGADALALRRLRRELRSVEIAAGGRRASGDLLVEALTEPAVLTLADERAVRPVRRLVALFDAARDAGSTGSAEDVLWSVWAACDLAPAWESASRAGGAIGAAADRDLDAMVAVFEAAARYVDRLPAAGPVGFLEHLAGQQIPGDTLAPRAPEGDTVRVLTAHSAKGLQWQLVIVAGVQEGVWPDLRRRGSLLGSELLVDVVAGRDPSGAWSVAPLLDEERRLFYVAVTRARRRLVVTAVRGDEEVPSRLIDELDPLPAGLERAFTDVPRALALPAMVAELRSVATDPGQRTSRRDAAAGQLARLARAGVAGAAPEEWWGLAPLSDERPLRDPDQPVPVSPSAVEKFGRCQLRWLLESVGATSGPGTPQAIGNLIHDLAAWSAGPEHPDPGDLADRLDGLLSTLDLGGPWAERKERARAHAMLGNFLGWLGSHHRELVGAEVPVEVAVGERAMLYGRVDRLERDEQGRLVVIDLKTGRSAPAKGELPRQPQLGVYQLAITEGGFADLADNATTTGGAALVQLGTSASAKVQEQPALTEDEDPGWARELVENVAAGMGGAAFRAVPGPGCRICPGRPSCPPSTTDGRCPTSDDSQRASGAEDGRAPMTGGTRTAGWSAEALADALSLPHPTSEQEAVIVAPLAPAVVVAGAGSGKTETMVSRVVWLVANGHVAADRVLGLTFTTKAAAELGARLRSRLGQLRARPEFGLDEAAAGEPTVLTYHSYASRLVGEHALRLAVEPSSRLLTPASTWQVAAKVVNSFDGDLPSVENSEAHVVSSVLDLAGELAEHLVDPDRLAAWTATFVADAEALPRKDRRTGPYADVAKVLKSARARAELVPLLNGYRQAKRDAGSLDFGDQLALAARVARAAAEVGRIERSRYDVILLDEYQDTSYAQLVLLQELFGGGHPVTAVGDPCQSIYGWRGAAAGSLGRFPVQFPARGGRPAEVLPLTTSFRNGRRILDVANHISAPLRASGVDVGVLSPGPACGEAAVTAALLSTVDDEAEWVADRLTEIWTADADERERTGRGRSIAVLARRRAAFSLLERALRVRGVPVELVGLGGLLATPEVRDVVATLSVLHDPTAGSALVRLLTGARWRIGPRDLAALYRRARALAKPVEHDGDPVAVDPAEDASLIEALDSPGPPGVYSAEGYRRLTVLRGELIALRLRTASPLPELVADVERTLRVDVEVVAGGGTRAHLDRFLDVAAQFAEDAEYATLGAFLAYLQAAESQERGLEAGEISVTGDRVQILTVHAAKGLEWDVVAVPGLTAKVFPDAKSMSGTGWTTALGALPYPLRGDAAELPRFEVADAADQKELATALSDYAAAGKERGEREERRLAYVAVTRARQRLLCSGYWWDTAIDPRGPSDFLSEIATVASVDVVEWVERPGEDEVNPVLERDRSAMWPIDPLGTRRVAVAEAADRVTAALENDDPGAGQGELFDAEATEWADDVTLLLAERDKPRSNTVAVPIGDHLSVSALVTLRRDPAELARRIRRPMPARPAPLARRGTAFHTWLEQRFAGERLLDLDELPGAADDSALADADLETLQQAFLASTWADRRPVEVEVPFETRIGALLVRGRMDAVFADADGGYSVVDWKTGAEPTGAGMRAAAVQLAAYRVAWAELTGVEPELVRAAFHYVRSGKTVAPVDLLDAAGLVELVGSLPAD